MDYVDSSLNWQKLLTLLFGIIIVIIGATISTESVPNVVSNILITFGGVLSGVILIIIFPDVSDSFMQYIGSLVKDNRNLETRIRTLETEDNKNKKTIGKLEKENIQISREAVSWRNKFILERIKNLRKSKKKIS